MSGRSSFDTEAGVAALKKSGNKKRFLRVAGVLVLLSVVVLVAFFGRSGAPQIGMSDTHEALAKHVEKPYKPSAQAIAGLKKMEAAMPKERTDKAKGMDFSAPTEKELSSKEMVSFFDPMTPATDEKGVQVAADGGRWYWVPGRLINVAIDARGALYGCNRGHLIWACTGWNRGRPNWRRLPGRLMEISVDGAGTLVAGVNRYHSIFYRYGVSPGRLGGSYWVGVYGRLKDVSVGGSTWGVNRYDQIWRKNNYGRGGWRNIAGRLKQVSCHGGFVVGVNRYGQIWRNMGGNRWHPYPGRALWASMGTDGTFWVVGMNQRPYRWMKGRWYIVPGRSIKQVDVANRFNIAAVDRWDRIMVYRTVTARLSSEEAPEVAKARLEKRLARFEEYRENAEERRSGDYSSVDRRRDYLKERAERVRRSGDNTRDDRKDDPEQRRGCAGCAQCPGCPGCAACHRRASLDEME